MFSSLTNLCKATVGVVITPVATMIDVLSLPSSAYNDKPPFGKTTALIKNVGHCIEEVTKPVKG